MDYLVLLSSIVLGAFTVFWFRFHEPARIKLLNAFTGAYPTGNLSWHHLWFLSTSSFTRWSRFRCSSR